MTSCPSEEELVLFMDDGLDADTAADVGDHLTTCADCRRLLARSEAALRYALGGVADRERAAPVARRFPWGRVAAAAAIVAAAVAVATSAPRPATTGPASAAPNVRVAPTIDDRLDELLARAARIGPTPDATDDVAALAALAAAQARADLGLDTAEARLLDVIEEFPDTTEAREARARLATLGGGR